MKSVLFTGSKPVLGGQNWESGGFERSLLPLLPPLDLADWHGACASSTVPPPLGSERPATRWGSFQNMIIDYSWPGQGEEDGQVRSHKDCLVPFSEL